MSHPSKDPFEIAYDDDDEEQEMEESLTTTTTANDDVDDELINNTTATNTTMEEEEEEEEEDAMEMDISKFPSSSDPDKIAKMQAILSQFTPEQMARYEKFRRSGFGKAGMRKLLATIIGTNKKIPPPVTIVVSGIAKMFVGELVETARIVMNERKETGPTRPCHIREAYRRLKLEGKMPKRSVPRLFR